MQSSLLAATIINDEFAFDNSLELIKESKVVDDLYVSNTLDNSILPFYALITTICNPRL